MARNAVQFRKGSASRSSTGATGPRSSAVRPSLRPAGPTAFDALEAAASGTAW